VTRAVSRNREWSFENGLGLDSWVEDLISSAGSEEQTVVELSEGLDLLESGEHEEEHGAEEPGEEGEHAHEHAEGNPHFWLDVANAEHYVERIQDTLIEADPDGARSMRRTRGVSVGARGAGRVHKGEAEAIPEERRKLVTFHDAFPYFAEAYDSSWSAWCLANPEAEPGSREVAEVVRTIEEEEVPVVSRAAVQRRGWLIPVAQEAGVEVGECTLIRSSKTRPEARTRR
jgi:ABC-type Zn uptake system ZnuABC Zn-binding protein ZnuA